MKLALVTDLHANREAVEAVLARGQGAARYAFLGDFVGYGADAGWVVDLVKPRRSLARLPHNAAARRAATHPSTTLPIQACAYATSRYSMP